MSTTSKPSMPMEIANAPKRTNISAGLVLTIQVTMGPTEMDTLTEMLTNMVHSGALNDRERMVAADFVAVVDDARHNG